MWNLRKLPEIVKPLVDEGIEEYTFKGDRLCFLRKTGANVVGDQRYGPQIANDTNTH